MNTPIATSNNFFSVILQDLIEYPSSGIFSKVLLKDNSTQCSLVCLIAGREIAEHTSIRNVVITVVEGKGNLDLLGEEIALTPGVFIFVPANTLHAVQARENLAFILALGESSSPIQEKNPTPETLKSKYNLQNPAHAIYLGIGDRDW